MRVLVGCEYSGRVRQAFRNLGHDAFSCDLLESEDGSPFHIQGDVIQLLTYGWDMAIFHPPCTHLAVSGSRWFKDKVKEQADALVFVQTLMDAPIPKIAIENPVSVISSKIRKADQTINQAEFGSQNSKTICLWLKNLPKLKPTNPTKKTYSCACGCNFPLELGKYGCPNCMGENKVVTGFGHKVITSGGKVLPKWYNLPPSPDRWKKRSTTDKCFANAMAEQWGGLILGGEMKLINTGEQSCLDFNPIS